MSDDGRHIASGPASFLHAIADTDSFADGGTLGRLFGGGHSGSAPVPFDALDGHRLAGPQGSHPLAGVVPTELVRVSTGALDGRIEITGPVRVGESIAGRLTARVIKPIRARRAGLRVVGVRLSEEQRSHEERDSEGRVTRSEHWVEVHGAQVDALEYTDTPLPTTLDPGQELNVPFLLPAPRLGPPSAHAGVALVAWAVEARWDIERGSDERVATLVEVRQHPDLLRAGVIAVGAGAMADIWADGGASLNVRPAPPIAAGSEVELTVAWAGAPSGRSARIELVADVKASNATSVVIASITLPLDALVGSRVVLPIPADAPPTCETKGLRVDYRIDVIVDRPFRPDARSTRRIVVS